MNSPVSHATSATATTSRKRKVEKEEEGSSMVISKRARFLLTYRRQSFSLPDSIMHYIAKNPKSLIVYAKLICTCKYFFRTNPILVFRDLYYNDEIGWQTLVDEAPKNVNLNNVSAKLWITEEYGVDTTNSEKQGLTSSIGAKIYQSNIKKLFLCKQVISYNELLFIGSNVENLYFNYTTIKQQDGTVLPFQKLVEALPKLKTVQLADTLTDPTITCKTFKELVKLPHFSTLDLCELCNLTDTFDLESFYAYMKTNKHTKFELYFTATISDAFKTRLEQIIDEIVEAETHDYQPPLTGYPGADDLKMFLMRIISYAH